MHRKRRHLSVHARSPRAHAGTWAGAGDFSEDKRRHSGAVANADGHSSAESGTSASLPHGFRDGGMAVDNGRTEGVRVNAVGAESTNHGPKGAIIYLVSTREVLSHMCGWSGGAQKLRSIRSLSVKDSDTESGSAMH